MESSYSIIIPIHNEIKSIPQLLKELEQFSFNNEIIIINDGSNDGSKILLEKYSFIKLINLKNNRGKGIAIKVGINSAKNKKIIIYDGDLELKTIEIKNLMILDKNKKINFILGSRFLTINQYKSLWDFGNYLITKLFNLIFQSNLSDALCCSKSFYKKDIPLKNIFSTGFDIDIEITSYLIKSKKKYITIPLSYSRRTKKEGKKLRYRDTWIIISRIIYSSKRL